MFILVMSLYTEGLRLQGNRSTPNKKKRIIYSLHVSEKTSLLTVSLQFSCQRLRTSSWMYSVMSPEYLLIHSYKVIPR